VSNAPSKPVSFSRPKVGYFSNRPRIWTWNKQYEQEYQTCIGASVTLKKGYQPRTNKIDDEKGQQNWLKQEVGQFVPRSINILIPFGIRRKCLSRGRSQLMYLIIKRVMKQTVVIIEARLLRHTIFVNYIQNPIQHLSVRVNSICWGC